MAELSSCDKYHMSHEAPKYLLSGFLQKKFSDLCSGVVILEFGYELESQSF
jgi:hypothetical protein